VIALSTDITVQLSMAYAKLPQWTEKTKEIDQPQHNDNDHDSIQDGFDCGLHGNEAIDKPQQDTNNYERDDYLHERHGMTSFVLQTLIRSPESQVSEPCSSSTI
jgi:hypothetical protein